MRTASRRFLNAIGSSNRWVTKIEWSNDGDAWSVINLAEGSVTRDLGQQVHWQASLTLPWEDRIQPFNTRIRIQHGIAFGPGDHELLTFGLYTVTDRTHERASKIMTVDLESFEHFVIQCKYTKPKKYPAATARATLNKIISEAIPETQTLWADGVDPLTPIPPVVAEQDRWSLVDGTTDDPSIAAAVGGRVITDGAGAFWVVPVPTLADDPVFSIKTGRGGALLSRSETLSIDGAANIIVAKGESTEGTVAGPVIVGDADPSSPTWYARWPQGGGVGRRPRFYTSPLLINYGQCERAARSILAQRLGVQEQLSFGSLHHPCLEPGDVVDLGDNRRAILDSVTYDLRGGPMQAGTRTVRSSLAGSIITLTEDLSEE